MLWFHTHSKSFPLVFRISVHECLSPSSLENGKNEVLPCSSEKPQFTVSSLWCHVFTEMTFSTLLFRTTTSLWFRASIAAGVKDYAGFTDRYDFFFPPLFLFFCMSSISLQTEFGPGPAARRSPSISVSLFQTKPVPFTIEPENSHQCSGSGCAQFNTHIEAQHAVQSLSLQCAIDKMSARESNCKEHPLCVSLL